jgi:hydroxymethylpyrimidine pyrophosphatase-like HAD family hydrolase
LRPLAEAEIAALRSVRFVLTDMDETLTYRDRLSARTYDALERLQRANVTVIPVTNAAPAQRY